MAGRKGRSGDQPLVYVDEDSIKALRAVQAEIAKRADGAAMTRKLNKALSTEAKKVLVAQRQSAKGLDFESASSGNSGTSRFNRSNRSAGVTKSGRKRQGRTLRDELASSIRVKVSKDNKGGRGAGVRIVQNSRDKDVNKIGRRLNRRGKVRHPLFGMKEPSGNAVQRFRQRKRQFWFDTKAANGVDWFWEPFAERRDDIRAAIGKVLDEWTRELARDIDRKA